MGLRRSGQTRKIPTSAPVTDSTSPTPPATAPRATCQWLQSRRRTAPILPRPVSSGRKGSAAISATRSGGSESIPELACRFPTRQACFRSTSCDRGRDTSCLLVHSTMWRRGRTRTRRFSEKALCARRATSRHSGRRLSTVRTPSGSTARTAIPSRARPARTATCRTGEGTSSRAQRPAAWSATPHRFGAT